MKKVTLQDISIGAEILLISYDPEGPEGDNTKIVELDLASLSYFEIVDNVFEMGLMGNVTYPNWGSMLNILNFEAPFDDDRPAPEQYLLIDLKGEETEQGVDTLSNGYQFLASAKVNSSLMSSAIDVKQTLNFEEYTTSLFKKVSIKALFEKGNPKPLPNARTIEGIKSLIASIVTDETSDVGIKEPLKDFFQPKIDPGEVLPVAAAIQTQGPNYRGSGDLSVYDAILNYMNFSCGGVHSGFRPFESEKGYRLLKLKTTAIDNNPTPDLREASTKRVLELDYMFTDKHLEFIQAYINNEDTATDFADVYQEEFVIAPTEARGVNSNMSNNVEKYDLNIKDTPTLKEKVWGEYTFSPQSASSTSIHKAPFNYFLVLFENMLSNNGERVKSNLPKIGRTNCKHFSNNDFTPVVMSDNGRPAVIQSFCEMYRMTNLIISSFMLVNDEIVITTPGRLYRKSGKFITVKSESFSGRPDELWFITKVKHIVLNGEYKNEITACRFLATGTPVEFKPAEVGVSEGKTKEQQLREAKAKWLEDEVKRQEEMTTTDLPFFGRVTNPYKATYNGVDELLFGSKAAPEPQLNEFEDEIPNRD
jgi:hypothetical protein